MNYEWFDAERTLKVVIPLRFNWLLVALYSLTLLVWVIMLAIVGTYLVSGRSTSLVLTSLLLVWGAVWIWFGRFLWRRWQYEAATREVLFFDFHQVLLRRPISILGLTTSYEFEHISPLYYSTKHKCPAFDYAYLHVYFGQSLSRPNARELISRLNGRFFPDSFDENPNPEK